MVKNHSQNPYAEEDSNEALEVDKNTIKEKTDEFKKEFEELMRDKSVENIKNIEFFLQSVEKTIELADEVKDAKSVKRFKSQLNDLKTRANELLHDIGELSSSEPQEVKESESEIPKTEQEKVEPEINFIHQESFDTKIIADEVNKFIADYSENVNNIMKDINKLQEYKLQAMNLLNDLNSKIKDLENQKNIIKELSGLNKLRVILGNLIEEIIVFEDVAIHGSDINPIDKIVINSDKKEKSSSDKLDDFNDFQISKSNNIQELNDFLILCEELKKEMSSKKYVTRIEESILRVKEKIKLLLANSQSADNINTQEKEQKGHKIILPGDAVIVRALQDKLEEYKQRLISRRQKDFYKAPELFTDTNYKIAILEKLLLDGEVDTYAISKKLMQIYGFVDASTFENACRVIEEYAKDGGRSVRGGTGLKIKETIVNSQPETPKEVESLVDTNKEESALSETQQSSEEEKIADVAESPSEAKEFSEPEQQEKKLEDSLEYFRSFNVNQNNNIEELKTFIVLCEKLKKEVSGKKDKVRIHNKMLEAKRKIELLSSNDKQSGSQEKSMPKTMEKIDLSQLKNLLQELKNTKLVDMSKNDLEEYIKRGSIVVDAVENLSEEGKIQLKDELDIVNVLIVEANRMLVNDEYSQQTEKSNQQKEEQDVVDNQNQKQEKKGFFSKIKSWFKSQSQHEEKTGTGEILQDKEVTDKKPGKINREDRENKVKENNSDDKRAVWATTAKILYNVFGSAFGFKFVVDSLGAGAGLFGLKIGKRTDVYKYHEQQNLTKKDKKSTKSEFVRLIEAIKPSNEKMQAVYGNEKYKSLINEMSDLLDQYKKSLQEYKEAEKQKDKSKIDRDIILDFNKINNELLDKIRNKGQEKFNLKEQLIKESGVDKNSLHQSASQFNQFLEMSKTTAFYDLPKDKRVAIEEKIKSNSLSKEERANYVISNHDKKTMKRRLGGVLSCALKEKDGLNKQNQKNIDKVLGDYILGSVRGMTLVKDAMNTALVLSGGIVAGGFRAMAYAGFAGEEKGFRYDVKHRKNYSWNEIGKKLKLNTKLVDLFRSSVGETWNGLSGKQYVSGFNMKDNKLNRVVQINKAEGFKQNLTVRAKAWGEILMILGMGVQAANAIASSGASLEKMVDSIADTYTKGNVIDNFGDNLFGYINIPERIHNFLKIFNNKSSDLSHQDSIETKSTENVIPQNKGAQIDSLGESSDVPKMNISQIHEIANRGLVVAKGSSVSETLNMNIPAGSKMTLITIDKLGNPITHENIDANLVAPGARVIIDSNNHITLIDENSNHASWYEYYIKNPEKVVEVIEAGKINAHTTHIEQASIQARGNVEGVSDATHSESDLGEVFGEDITHGTLTTEGKISYQDLLSGDRDTIRQFLVFNRPGGLYNNGEFADQDLGTDFDKIYYNADLTPQEKIEIFSKIHDELQSLKSQSTDDNVFSSLSILEKGVNDNIDLLNSRIANELPLELGNSNNVSTGNELPISSKISAEQISVPAQESIESVSTSDSGTALPIEPISTEPESIETSIPDTSALHEISTPHELYAESIEKTPTIPADDILTTKETTPIEYLGESKMVKFDDYGEFHNVHTGSNLKDITIGDKVYDVHVSEVIGDKIRGIATDAGGHKNYIEFKLTDRDLSGGGPDEITSKFGAEVSSEDTNADARLFDDKSLNENIWQDKLIPKDMLSQVKTELNNLISRDNLLPKDIVSKDLSSVAPNSMSNSAVNTFLDPDKNFVTKINAIKNVLQDGQMVNAKGGSFAKIGDDVYYMIDRSNGVKLDNLGKVNKIINYWQSSREKVIQSLK